MERGKCILKFRIEFLYLMSVLVFEKCSKNAQKIMVKICPTRSQKFRGKICPPPIWFLIKKLDPIQACMQKIRDKSLKTKYESPPLPSNQLHRFLQPICSRNILFRPKFRSFSENICYRNKLYSNLEYVWCIWKTMCRLIACKPCPIQPLQYVILSLDNNK